MSRFLFISVYDINAEGIRTLSSLLKKNGQDSYIVFLKRLHIGPVRSFETDWIGVGENGKFFQHAAGKPITTKELKLLFKIIKDISPSVIGFTVCSPTEPTVKKLSDKIRESFNIPIIWGGPHATMSPLDCLPYCDFVCIGEADSIIVDLAQRMDLGLPLQDIPGIINREAESQDVIFPCPLVENLNKLPFKDISRENKYLIEDDSLIHNFSEISYSGDYHVISSRGCPYRCTYCCEDAYKRLYSSKNFLRRKSPSIVVEEIKKAKEILDFQFVHFEDEVFTFDIRWLYEFSDLYKFQIDLPFSCYLFPTRDLEKKVHLLKSVGLKSALLSLQSGSKKINKAVFRRPFNRDMFLSCAQILHAEGIKIATDVITYNPFETEDDLINTLDILAEMPKPFHLDVNKLYVLKNTEIDRIIRNDKPDSQVSKKTFSLYTRLFWMTPYSQYVSFLSKYMKSFKLFRIAPMLINPLLINRLFQSLTYAVKNLRLLLEKMQRN